MDNNTSWKLLYEKGYTRIKELLFRAATEGTMEMSVIQEAAQFTTLHYDLVESKQELFVILQKMAEKWPIIKQVYIELKAEESKQTDQQKLEDLQKKLRELTNLSSSYA